MIDAAVAFVEGIFALRPRRQLGVEGRRRAQSLDLTRGQRLETRRFASEGGEFHRRRAGVQGQNQFAHAAPLAQIVL
jgi:hypothetical protein